MEFFLCFLIAMVITGGRSASEIIHARRGTEPPWLAKARLRAEQARNRPSPEGPSPFRAYWGQVWDDAWIDAKAHHERARAEKRAGTRPRLGERARRFRKTVMSGQIRLPWERQPGQPWIDRPAGVATATDPGRAPRPDDPCEEAATDPAADPWEFAEPVDTQEPVQPPESRRPDGEPETDADRRFFDLRESGYTVDGPEFARTDDNPDPNGGTDMTEAVDVTTAHQTCRQLALQLAGVREVVSAQMTAAQAQVDQMARTAETLDASARSMEFDAATLDQLAAVFEALNGLSSALRTCTAEVTSGSEAAAGAASAAEAEFGKHLAGVEFSASVGGMARREAYTGEGTGRTQAVIDELSSMPLGDEPRPTA